MSKRPLLGSHQRSWIWGRNLVTETLRSGRWRPYEVHLTGDGDQELRELAERGDIAVQIEEPARLTQLCGATDHQGVIAKMPPFPYATADDVLSKPETPLIVITDHLQDPYNFGAIIRCAEGFAATGIFIPEERQVGVTSQVARSSAGGVNHVPIARTDDLVALVHALRARGVCVVAASERGSILLPDATLAGPVAIVIGNEGTGIEPRLLDECDQTVAIPLAGRVGSLNAAVAAGILLYEAARQRTSSQQRTTCH